MYNTIALVRSTEIRNIDGVATSLGFKKLHVDRASVRGNTQQVLDPKATPFTRIWCCFEEATVAQGRKLLLDMATVQDGKCVLLTDGLANECEKCARSFVDIGSAQIDVCESDCDAR